VAHGYRPGQHEPVRTLAEREIMSKANAAAAKPLVNVPPARFDLRNVGGQNYVTAVQDQGQCGSCVAFGVVAAVEATLRVKYQDPDPDNASFSEAHLFYCHAVSEGRTCKTGWDPEPALDVFRVVGVVYKPCFPYVRPETIDPKAPPEFTPPCQVSCTDWQGQLGRIEGWHYIDDFAGMKRWISSGSGALVACYTIWDDFDKWFFTHAPGAAYKLAATAKATDEGHCVCVVGYDDAGRYWICKNSWGTANPDQGFFNIGYGQVGIDAYMWAVDG
jgi:hypothetical protein